MAWTRMKLTQTGGRDRAMLGHLVTIGTYLNQASWGDSLQKINSIGPKWESRLRDHGITTFKQIVEMDEETKASLKKLGFPRPPIDKWIVSAGKLDRTPAADADRYLEKVKALMGSETHFDSTGDVAPTGRVNGEVATRNHDNIFDAPTHDRSQDLAQALRAFVGASGGVAKVPNLKTDQVAVLELVRDSLGPRQNVEDDTITALNRILETAEITLDRVNPAGEEFEIDNHPPLPNRTDPDNPYGKLPGANEYGIPAGEDPYGRVPSEAYAAPHLSSEEGPVYGDPDYGKAPPPGYYGPEASQSSEQSLRGGGGAKVEGVGFQPALPHESQQVVIPGDPTEAPVEREPRPEPVDIPSDGDDGDAIEEEAEEE